MGSGLTLVGSGRGLNPVGSIKFKATATWTVNPNATESYIGKLKVTGGSGFIGVRARAVLARR